MRIIRTLRRSLFVVFALTLLGPTCEDEIARPSGVPIRLAVVDATGSSDPWELLDRDSATTWVLESGVTSHLGVGFGSTPITRIKVRSSGSVRVVVEGHEARISGDGWHAIDLSTPVRGRIDVDLRGESENAEIAELEAWTLGEARPVEPNAHELSESESAEGFDVVDAAPSEIALTRGTDVAAPCATFTADLAIDPSSYRRAFLRYQTVGAFRPFALSRSVNRGSYFRGRFLASDEAFAIVEPIDIERLRRGENEFSLCLPADSTEGDVRLSGVRVVLEQDHGSNLVESLLVAPIDAAPTRSASAIFAGETSTIAANEELVVAFERLIAIDAIRIGTDLPSTWSARCVSSTGQATEVSTTSDGALLVVSAPERLACAGLRLRSQGATTVNELRVFGSGAARRVDFPRITLASPREHFGNSAWIDGWASSPSDVVGGTLVSIDDIDTGSTDGRFGRLLSRSGAAEDDWVVSIAARFSDGRSFTRQFVLDRDGGAMPGTPGAAPGTGSDGLTATERRARYGDVGQTASTTLSGRQAGRVALGSRVSVDVPAGATRNNTTIGLKHLDAAEVPPLDPGFINVTAPAGHGYEFTPHGTEFDQAVTITLPYDASQIPRGYVERDVETYYFDTELQRWQPLAKATMNGSDETVASLTDHFTVMINAIVVAPEHPGVTSFDGNSIRGIQAANPTSRIAMIAPPSANSQGTAGISYPFDLPQGRLGMQPSLALAYDSSGGNGWLGVGWDVQVPSVTIDTRFGAPRYLETLESESYVVAGAAVAPATHLGPFEPRSSEREGNGSTAVKRFHPRVESAFTRILRHGSRPSEFWWEVTDKSGTTHYFGARHDVGLVREQTLGTGGPSTDENLDFLYRWPLLESRDANGNSIRYEYEEVTHGAEVPGRTLYLKSIRYTFDRTGDHAGFRVDFVRQRACRPTDADDTRTDCRRDVVVSGRGGFKEAIAERLHEVHVYFVAAQGESLIRKWVLGYDFSPFHRSRLVSIQQFGSNGEPFPGNEHRFEYFDEVTDDRAGTPELDFNGFEEAHDWSFDGDDPVPGGTSASPSVGIFTPSALLRDTGVIDVSVLGGSRSRSFGGHFYLGYNPSDPSKSGSVGMKIGGNRSTTHGLVSLVDIDGDNLPDRVFRDGGDIRFHRNLGGPSGAMQFSATSHVVAGLDEMLVERSNMVSLGGELYYGNASVMANTSQTITTTRTFLADVNSDGLVDVVDSGDVRFNRISGGLPVFAATSAGTPVVLGASTVSTSVVPTDLGTIVEEFADAAPAVDTVRRWIAPYTGTVHVTGDVRLPVAQARGGDGVRVSIERTSGAANTTLWSDEIGPTDLTPRHPDLALSLNAGDILYFRVGSRLDGRDDRVLWSPVCEYTAVADAADENGLSVRRFVASDDFTLAGRGGIGATVPFEGTARVRATFTKTAATTDALAIRVLRRRGDTEVEVFRQDVVPGYVGSLPIDAGVDVEKDDYVSLRLDVDSAVDLRAFGFSSAPFLSYDDAVDANGVALSTVDGSGNPTFRTPLPYDITTYPTTAATTPASPSFTPTETGPVTISVSVGSFDMGATRVVATVKSQGRLLAKAVLTPSAPGAALEVDVVADQPVFVSVYAADGPSYVAAMTTTASVPLTGVYGRLDSEMHPRPYRGWSVFGVSVPGDAATSPLDPALLADDFDDDLASGDDLDDDYEVEEDRNHDGRIDLDDHTDAIGRLDPAAGEMIPFLPMPSVADCASENPAVQVAGEDPYAACRPMQPANTATPHWRGPQLLNYVTAGEMSSARLGADEFEVPSAASLAGTRGTNRVARGRQLAVSGGVSAVSGSMTTPPSASNSLLDFLDVNGDGYPDPVAQHDIQYSLPSGVLSPRSGTPRSGEVTPSQPSPTPDAVSIGYLRETETRSLSAGVGADIAHAQIDGRGHSGTAPRGSRGGAGGAQMPMLGVSGSVNGNFGWNRTEYDLIDVNGDGLPDRVRRSGTKLRVALNVGYNFLDEEPWGEANPHAGNSRELSGGASLSYSDGIYGLGGGVTAGVSRSRLRPMGAPIEQAPTTLLDVNSDGLIDRVVPHAEGMLVWLNRGNRLSQEPVLWRGGVPIDRAPNAGDLGEPDENRGVNVGASGYFTISVPLCTAACYLIINPGMDAGTSVSHPVFAVRDVDGDGLADHVRSTGSDELLVARNHTGRTDLLRHVVRPLGAEFWIDYERVGNTYDLPSSRWVMSEVKVYDGQEDSASLRQANDYQLTRLSYEGGRYDRRERDFYGFARVVTDVMDTRGWDGVTSADVDSIYRSSDARFANDSLPRKGLLLESFALAGQNRQFVYSHAKNFYELRDAETNRPIADADISSTRSIFPAIRRAETTSHEGNPAVGLATFHESDYDEFGNVVEYRDAGDLAEVDDTIATIGYATTSSCVSNHIVGAANHIVVRDGRGVVLRERESNVDCATGNVTSVSVHLDGSGLLATTDIQYNVDGTIHRVIAPPNHRGQRYDTIYTYDSVVASHVTHVVDSYGYTSDTDWNYPLGVPNATTDANGETISHTYDPFGRTYRVLGPLERARSLPYTVEFDYRQTNSTPTAITRHMDMFRDVADPIETVAFVDGLGRALQTKHDVTVHRGDTATAQDVMAVSGRIAYDPWGRVTANWHPFEEAKDGSGNDDYRDVRPGDNDPVTRISIDVRDRVEETTLQDGSRSSMAYGLAIGTDGTLRAITIATDAEGHQRTSETDARGLVRAIVEHHDGRGITTRYAYDPMGQIRSVRDAAGNLTASEYDLAGRRVAVVNPDSGKDVFQFDPAGNLIATETPNLRALGREISYEYDFTHLVGVDYPLNTDSNLRYVWGSSAMRGRPGHLVGRIQEIHDRSGTLTRQYGALGEKIEETRRIASHTEGNSANGPEVWTTRFVQDSWGRVQEMRYPDGEVLTYGYDSGGHIRSATGVKLGETFEYVRRLEYDVFEQRVFQQTANGIITHLDYEPARRRLAVIEGGEFQRLHYTYDRVGNITHLANQVPVTASNEFGGPVDQSFVYDDLNRLTNASGEWRRPHNRTSEYTLAYGYDDIHNLTRKNQSHWVEVPSSHAVPQHETTYDVSYDYGQTGNAGPHAATHIGDRTFHYDRNGNQSGWDDDTSGQRRRIVWDEENRIRSISDNGRTTEYIYDAEGRRVFKVGAQGETVYVNDFWTVRNRTVGTKHIFVGPNRIASKLSPGEAHVDPDTQDLVVRMLGRWFEHRSDSGHENGSNVEMNPHYRVPSTVPSNGLPDSNFLYFYHSDHLGSTSYVTDGDGELYEHVQYFPGGEPWVDQHSNTERLPSLFTSKELDQETGLYDIGARQYDPRTQLWTTVDPQRHAYLAGGGLNGGVLTPVQLNPYAYSGHNPITLLDPDGRVFNLAAAAIGAGVGALIGGAFEAGRQLITNGEVTDWGRVGAAAAGGAVSGLAAGFTMGGSLIATAAVEAGASVAGTLVENGLNGEENTVGGLVTSAALGGAGGVAGDLLSAGVRTARGMFSAAADATDDVGRAVANNVSPPSPSSATPPVEVNCSGGFCGTPDNCFVAGTPVRVVDGSEPIESVRPGTRVRTLNEDACSHEAFEATLLEVTLLGPTPGSIEILRSDEWVAALALSEGSIFTIDDEELGRSPVRVDRMTRSHVEGGVGCAVTGTVVHPAVAIVRVGLSTGETIETTPFHPFFVEERSDFVPAAELEVGASLRAESGERVAVESLEAVPSDQDVYNLEIDGSHTYVVGASRVWVHNGCFQQRAAELRQSIGGRFAAGEGNIGFAQGSVDGRAIDLAASSGSSTPTGTVGNPASRRFSTTPSGAMTRDFDTEVLLLEDLASSLRPDSTGTIRLFTEKAPCRSCGGVIDQFRAAFPGIDLQVVTGQ